MTDARCTSRPAIAGPLSGPPSVTDDGAVPGPHAVPDRAVAQDHVIADGAVSEPPAPAGGAVAEPLAPTDGAVAERRRGELAGRLAEVRARLAAAATSAGRSPAEVTLVAVTKTYPASDVKLLATLGVTDVGENRDQEAAPKAAQVTADPAVPALRWHFIGQLQRNKCRSVAGYADLVQSVDRVSLARALSAAAGRLRERPLDVLIQINLDGGTGRGGVALDSADPEHGLWPVVEAVLAQSDLRLAGVMAVAPLGQPAEPAFARLAQVSAQVRAVASGASIISAGMSGDLEAAVAAGATHVRVGSALLGNRPTLR